MKSLHAGTYFGIPIKIHWTFSLMFVILLSIVWYNGAGSTILFSYAFFILFMFFCVILHEYGHALTARRYGVETLDIIISPIGGIARMKRLPDKPTQELAIAIAGPLVNLAIALILFLIALIVFRGIPLSDPEGSFEIIATPHGFLAVMIYINCILFVFNLVPAFPMDGGRILRAFLSMRFGKVDGTRYASLVGRVLAVLFVLIGLYTQAITIIFIGIFVFVMARSENKQILIQSKLSGHVAGDIMNPNYTRLHLSEKLRNVYNNYIRGGEKNYVIFDSMGNVSGVLPELFIKEAFKDDDLDKSVHEYMSRNILYVDEEIPLDKLFEEMNVKGAAIAIIKKGDQLPGVVDRQMLYDFIQLQLTK